jgi:hypothetical protein
MKKILNFIKSHILQLILLVAAILSWFQVVEIANTHFSGRVAVEPDTDENWRFIGSDVTSGLDGGAQSMGIICCVCIIMIVWIEINKKPKP